MNFVAAVQPTKARYLALAACLSYTSAYTLLKLLPKTITSFEALFVRSVIGAFVALCVARALRLSWNVSSVWSNFLRSIFGLLAIGAQYVALHEGRCPLSTVAFLRQAAPLWVLCLSGPWLGEWPDRRAKLAVVAGVLGTIAATSPESERGIDWGTVVAASSGILAAGALLSMRSLAGKDHPAVVVAFFMLVMAIATAPFAVHRWALDGGPATWTLRELLLVLGSALLGTLGQLLMTAAMQYGKAVTVSLVGVVEVSLAILVSWLVLGEGTPSITAAAGGATIVGAAMWASRHPEAVIPQGQLGTRTP